MDKKGGVYIVIAIFTITLLMLLQYNKPKEVNWFPSFVAKHKIPYGTFVLNDIVQNMFPEKTRQVDIPPYAFLSGHNDVQGTYFFVNDRIEFGATEIDKLLDWVSKGNALFIASGDFEEKLLDTLGLKTVGLYSNLEDIESHRHRLVNPQLKTENGFLFEKDDYVIHFQERDSIKMTVIGTVTNSGQKNPKEDSVYNIIRTSFGSGEIVLSTFPKAFTNYFILKDNNKDYTAGILSYIDDSRAIYMDNHYKSGKSVYTSPMYIFLNTKEFKWAYYLVLIGALLYIVFEGKRKQRAIPVLKPVRNQTLAFTRTIADLYYEKGESKKIVEHKIAYFLDYIRSHFYLGTIQRETDFYQNLASRSSHSIEEIQKLFLFIERLRNQENISDIELKKLNTSIEKFKTKAHGK